MIGRIWNTKDSEWIRDVDALASADNPRKNDIQKAGFETALGVPIIADDNILAVMILYKQNTDVADERLTLLIETAARQLGLVLKRKQTEAKLRAREKLLSSVYEYVNTAIYIVDVTKTGEVLYAGANPAWEKMTGLIVPILRANNCQTLNRACQKQLLPRLRRGIKKPSIWAKL